MGRGPGTAYQGTRPKPCATTPRTRFCCRLALATRRASNRRPLAPPNHKQLILHKNITIIITITITITIVIGVIITTIPTVTNTIHVAIALTYVVLRWLMENQMTF